MLESFQKVKDILAPIIDNIPEDLLFDISRCKYLYSQIQKMDIEDRQFLNKTVEDLLYYMEELDASDIDMGSHGSKGFIWYRVQGKKRPEEQFGKLTYDETDLLIMNLLEEKQAKQFFNDRSLDFSFILERSGGQQRRLRATVYMDLNHVALNMRMVPAKIRPLSSYRFHKNIINSFSLKRTKRGLILVTGITGAGKSTTLDAIVDYNNKISNSHITIIADPIERVHNSQRAIVRHREVGSDVLSFREGAVQALRQDPDIIVIGEMRDPETIMTTLELTDSGHKVFSTLHTSSAIETIDRIIDEVPDEAKDQVKARLADVLEVIVSQKLIKGTDGKLILAKEVLYMNSAVSAAIKNENTHEIYAILRQGSKHGMHTLEQDLKRLYRANKISFEDAISNANMKKEFKDIVKYSL